MAIDFEIKKSDLIDVVHIHIQSVGEDLKGNIITSFVDYDLKYDNYGGDE